MDFVVRYQGGHNAGHRIVVEGREFALQLVPSGILYSGVTPVIGNGVVVDPAVLLAELDTLTTPELNFPLPFLRDLGVPAQQGTTMINGLRA